MKGNIILAKSIDFSVEIKKYSEVLISKKEIAIANQLLRSGMAIGANVSEKEKHFKLNSTFHSLIFTSSTIPQFPHHENQGINLYSGKENFYSPQISPLPSSHFLTESVVTDFGLSRE